MKELSVLLTVHNRKEKTLQCLKELYMQKGIGTEYKINVFLTDDGCTDGTPEAVRAQFPQVHVIQGDGSLFWNRGMYTAWIEAVKYPTDYFLWLNDDTFLYQDTISRLIINSKQHNDRSIILGSTCDTETRLKITYGGLNRKRETVHSNTEFLPCFYMHGNIVLIPMSVFEQIGFNDTYYRHSLGDHDYGLMAQKKGIQVLVSPGIYGECDVHAAISKWKNPQFPLKERWKAMFKPTGQNPFEFFYFRKKHFGLVSAYKSFVTMFIHVFFPTLWENDDCR